MPVHASTIEILIDKAHFEPRVAVAVAEAMDNAIKESQLVTIPVFENGIAELRRDIGDLRREVDARFDAMSGTLNSTLETKLAATKVEIIYWFIGTAIALAALLISAMAIAL